MKPWCSRYPRLSPASAPPVAWSSGFRTPPRATRRGWTTSAEVPAGGPRPAGTVAGHVHVPGRHPAAAGECRPQQGHPDRGAGGRRLQRHSGAIRFMTVIQFNQFSRVNWVVLQVPMRSTGRARRPDPPVPRSNRGGMVPLSALVTMQWVAGPTSASLQRFPRPR